jgi:S1-C subfamily serine protease
MMRHPGAARRPSVSNRGRVSQRLVLLVATLIAVVALTACSHSKKTSAQPGTASPSAASSRTAGAGLSQSATALSSQPGGAALTENTIAQVAAKSKPSIVQITNEQETLQPGGPQVIPAGVGTGFVIDGQGHILTNNHVIADAQKLQVLTTDGKTFPATLVGRDPQTDLAVIQVQGAGLPAMPLGDSSKLAVGQWVVAIGNALALPGGPTVTAGVVSALGRTIQEPGQGQQAGPFLFDLIQTDAAINPGNSGGPLIDLDGNAVGVNTLGATQAEPGVPAQGISFAIAINTAKQIADELIKNGKVEHAYLGIFTPPTLNTPALAARFGLPNKTGVIVADVQPGGPADKAGIKPKDVITAIDGQQIKTESDLPRILAQHKPGDTVTLTVARDGQTMDVKVTLGSAPPPGQGQGG